MTVLMVAPLDDEHLQFVIQLQLQEIEEANQAIIGKGKQSEGSQTDRQAALNHFMGELQSANNFAADSRMARSLQNAILHDGDALVQSQKEELAAQEDYAMATDLNEGRIGSLPTAADTGTPADDLEFLEKLSCIYITGTEGIDSDADAAHDLNEQDMGLQAESSSWAASRAPQNKPKRRCVACGDQKHFAEMAKAPCEHEYCRACLEHLFRDAMIDESFFPPRCCKQPIPLDKNQIFLVAEVARQFREKALEFSTPNRTYCHDPKCAAFIPPTNYDKAEAIATCDTCEGRTCMNCKKAQHGGDCPDDEELSQVLQLAREQGWQRCQNCWRLVELNTGCNHMTCPCGFHFYYQCGLRWKTCECAQWDETRLYERAVQIDQRNQPAQRPAAQGNLPAQRDAVVVEQALAVEAMQAHAQERRVQALVQNLRVNHECEHERWFGRGGPRECEECGDVMPLFIYECRQCHIMACRRCRYNRL
ncbi:hypothetical protein PG999_005607 [Apiospora kogelbergensis]|uniref:RBR-type E3 ubiquitin transferase n=1 Tax=Apiospora kogelbergensis TaxID=1337665 RepID=A0AAW0R2P1_9PEZI